jgi:hypothetical protein
MGSLADQSNYDPATGMPYPGNAPDYGDLSQRMTNAQQRLAAGIYEAGAMPGRAFGTVPGGPPTPEEEANWGAGTALGMLGASRLPGGAPAGAVGAGGAKLVQPEGIFAYHSSPYTFDKFDPSMIGTGEGAQSYGHGFYFAENPAVSGQGGQYWNSFMQRFPPHEMDAAQLLKQANFDRDKAIALAQQKVDSTRATIAGGSENAFALPMAEAFLPRDQAALDLLRSRQPIVGPRTYEVNINARPEQMLNWDAPLHAQPQMVEPLRRAGFNLSPAVGDLSYLTQKAAEAGPDSWYAAQLRAVGDMRNKTGAEFRPKTPDEAAALNEAGIPGIRYLDQGSRALGSKASPNDTLASILDAVGGDRAAALAEVNTRIQHAANLPAQYRSTSSNLPAVRDMLLDPNFKDPRTSNYVIFDPSRIDIRKMYAVPGAVGAGGMGALATQDNYQPQ